MEKLVVLTGSPRRNGNSSKMADSFINSAREKGFETIRFDTAFMRLDGCHACDKCYKKENACIFYDDFNKIAEAIEGADGIVIVSPVYWYTFTSQLKAAIDKFYSFWLTGKDFSNKKSGLISCCEETDMNAFTGIKFAYEKSMELLGCKSVGEVLIPGVYKAGDIKNTDGEHQASLLVEKFL